MRVLDISVFQGKIDWQAFKAWNDQQIDPVLGVYVKMSQGVNGWDPNTLVNAQGVNSIGLLLGFYHFATLNALDVRADAAAEAADVHTQIESMRQAGTTAALPLALDIETNNQLNLSPDNVQLWIQSFRQAFPTSILYSGQYFLNTNLPDGHVLGGVDLWIAEYSNNLALPKGWSTYDMWQYTCSAKVPGIPGFVDLSRTK